MCVCVCVCVCARVCVHVCVCARAQLLSGVQLFCDPIAYSPPGPSVYGTIPARILVAISFS